MTISSIRGRAPAKRTKIKFGMRGRVADIIICFKFYRNRLRGFRAARGQKWGSSIDFDSRPYNRSALPCCLWTDILCRAVSELSQLIVQILVTSRFWASKNDLTDDYCNNLMLCFHSCLSMSGICFQRHISEITGNVFFKFNVYKRFLFLSDFTFFLTFS